MQTTTTGPAPADPSRLTVDFHTHEFFGQEEGNALLQESPKSNRALKNSSKTGTCLKTSTATFPLERFTAFSHRTNQVKYFLSILLIPLVFSTSGCNSCARSFGGTTSLKLPCGSKLVNLTWKGDNLWYLTRPMVDGDVPQAYSFQEDSNLGVMEGTVHITECE